MPTPVDSDALTEHPTRHPLLAALYDGVMRPSETWLGIGRQRERTVGDAHGRVLELGFGTGLNLPYYAAIDELIAVEPDPCMRTRAQRRIDTVAPSFPVELVAASAEHLPLPDHHVDTVVIALTLCTVGDPTRALAEVHRVLRPAGRLLFMEHVRSTNPTVQWLQHAATPVWRNLAGGCHLDRTTTRELEAAGFAIERLWRSGDGRGSFVQGRARPARDHQ